MTAFQMHHIAPSAHALVRLTLPRSKNWTASPHAVRTGPLTPPSRPIIVLDCNLPKRRKAAGVAAHVVAPGETGTSLGVAVRVRLFWRRSAA